MRSSLNMTPTTALHSLSKTLPMWVYSTLLGSCLPHSLLSAHAEAHPNQEQHSPAGEEGGHTTLESCMTSLDSLIQTLEQAIQTSIPSSGPAIQLLTQQAIQVASTLNNAIQTPELATTNPVGDRILALGRRVWHLGHWIWRLDDRRELGRNLITIGLHVMTLGTGVHSRADNALEDAYRQKITPLMQELAKLMHNIHQIFQQEA